MNPPAYYIAKVEQALAEAETPPNNRFYCIQEAAAWASIAMVAVFVQGQQDQA